MLTIDTVIDTLGTAEFEYMSRMDFFNGYHQVPLSEDSKQYTSFVTPLVILSTIIFVSVYGMLLQTFQGA